MLDAYVERVPVLVRVMHQNFGSGNTTSPIEKCAHLKPVDIDRNCDVLPIVEYSIETDDGQTLN